jgi:hypothetical protein
MSKTVDLFRDEPVKQTLLLPFSQGLESCVYVVNEMKSKSGRLESSATSPFTSDTFG